MHRGQPEVTYFTHSDLSSFITLARDDKIVGIIDWETAGWYPAYWEFTTAHNVIMSNAFWQCEVSGFFEADLEALRVERIKEKFFGMFPYPEA